MTSARLEIYENRFGRSENASGKKVVNQKGPIKLIANLQQSAKPGLNRLKLVRTGFVSLLKLCRDKNIKYESNFSLFT